MPPAPPTPSTRHIPPDTPVYPPSEDSFLLLDALSLPSEHAYLRLRFPPSTPAPVVAEIGLGSGVVLAFALAHAQAIFGRSDAVGIGSDVSPVACKWGGLTVEKAIADGAQFLGCLQTSLAGALRENVVDVLIFNPPYVPSEKVPTREDGASEEDYLFELTHAGGQDGMEVTNALLERLDQILHRERGVLYLLLFLPNKPEVVAETLRNGVYGKTSWNVEKILERKAGWEVLSIWRITRKL